MASTVKIAFTAILFFTISFNSFAVTSAANQFGRPLGKVVIRELPASNRSAIDETMLLNETMVDVDGDASTTTTASDVMTTSINEMTADGEGGANTTTTTTMTTTTIGSMTTIENETSASSTHRFISLTLSVTTLLLCFL